MKIIIGVSSFAFQKFLDRYGEQIMAYAAENGEELLRVYGPRAVRWTTETGNNAYQRMAPKATGAISRLSAVAGRPAEGAIIPGSEESEGARLNTLLFGRFSGSVARVGAYVRAAAQVGAEQLGNLSDEQIGAIAVALWRAQSRDDVIGRQLRRRFWGGSAK